MIKVEIDISAIRNEVAQIHNQLHETYNMTDTQRRDSVNRTIEKLRTLKVKLDNTEIVAVVK